MRSRLTGTTVGLALGITAAVSVVMAGAAYFYSKHHFEAMLSTAREMGVAQGELIRTALEHQMIENDRTLIAQMIESFGRQPNVERVVILDREGVVRYSSVPAEHNGDLRIGSPTCQACHRYPPEHRGSSRVIETADGTVLRTVVPFRNHERCHACHDPARRINGILLLDRGVSGVRASMIATWAGSSEGRGSPPSCSSAPSPRSSASPSSAACSDSRPRRARSRPATSSGACRRKAPTRSRGSPASSTRWPTR